MTRRTRWTSTLRNGWANNRPLFAQKRKEKNLDVLHPKVLDKKCLTDRKIYDTIMMSSRGDNKRKKD